MIDAPFVDLVLEAHNIGPGGSEESQSRGWIECAAELGGFRNVFVVYGISNFSTADLEKWPHFSFIHVSRPEDPPWLAGLWSKQRHLPPRAAGWVREFGDRLSYWRWLTRAAETIESVRDASVPCLAVHVSQASLLSGTALRTRGEPNFRTAVAGALPLPLAPGFVRYLPAVERVAYARRAALVRLTRNRRRVDFIAPGHPYTKEELRRFGESQPSQVVRDPVTPLPFHAAKRPGTLLFVDTAHMPRKGSAILRDVLANTRPEDAPGLTYLIATPRPAYWQAAHPHCVPLPWMTEQEFQALLLEVEFILSASWREGRGTSIIRAATAGAIPIVPNTLVFDDIPVSCAIKFDCSRDAAEGLTAALRDAARMPAAERATKRGLASSWATQAGPSRDAMINALRTWRRMDTVVETL